MLVIRKVGNFKHAVHQKREKEFLRSGIKVHRMSRIHSSWRSVTFTEKNTSHGCSCDFASLFRFTAPEAHTTRRIFPFASGTYFTHPRRDSRKHWKHGGIFPRSRSRKIIARTHTFAARREEGKLIPVRLWEKFVLLAEKDFQKSFFLFFWDDYTRGCKCAWMMKRAKYFPNSALTFNIKSFFPRRKRMPHRSSLKRNYKFVSL